MKLLLIIPLFLAAVIGTQAEVLNNFDTCKNFFYKERIPSGFERIAQADLFNRQDMPDGITDNNDLRSPAYICQTFENTHWFATLYDRGRLMPLYSAYILDVRSFSSDCKRLRAFKVEPQLVFRGADGNMMPSTDARNTLGKYSRERGISQSGSKNQPSNLLSTSQAEDKDYKIEGYDRGHLNPCGHQKANQGGHHATFTLTNAVPMAKYLNNKIWSEYEKSMARMAAQCTRMYVITGIVPGNVPIKGSRLTSPEYIWNAYCGVDNNNKPLISGAALAENKDKGKIKHYIGTTEFESELRRLLGDNSIELFEGDCKISK